MFTRVGGALASSLVALGLAFVGLGGNGADVTRGQLAKILASAANLQDPVPAQQQTFADVPGDPNPHPFWLWIERLVTRQAISGYACGGPGEPGDGQQRPYFRPYANTTRGQLAKIAAQTFYPGCRPAAWPGAPSN